MLGGIPVFTHGFDIDPMSNSYLETIGIPKYSTWQLIPCHVGHIHIASWQINVATTAGEGSEDPIEILVTKPNAKFVDHSSG